MALRSRLLSAATQQRPCAAAAALRGSGRARPGWAAGSTAGGFGASSSGRGAAAAAQRAGGGAPAVKEVPVVDTLEWSSPLQIIKYPDPRLRAVNARVGAVDPQRLLALAAEMFDLMYHECLLEARAERVDVRYHDVSGALHEKTLRGWVARIFQHEYDHLQGVLYHDRMKAGELAKVRERIVALEEEFVAANPGVAVRRLGAEGGGGGGGGGGAKGFGGGGAKGFGGGKAKR
ncbi:peptide deformylase [Raphidocelis subcapitata]|uniref:Peptide deformylase n=1 Tax=Raphidocelis subcapitata TaxID=307507 RepID=A0A2V0PCB6_9CHLO|nr:peptide deformylase [Raphidocelis subcapitata]|eukprot:GBF97179.1 peptide deformylase [Raphidocelis subcapitata]